MESLIILISQYSYLEIIEGTLGSNAVYQDESLTILHVQISHGCELFLEKNTIYVHNTCIVLVP